MGSKFSPWLSLFASVSTLLCCALPSLFVVLGMGATLAGFIGIFPQVVWVSQYKGTVFMISGSLILLSVILHYLNRNATCPIDPELAANCKKTRAWSLRVLLLSGTLWLIGAFFAFLAPLIF